MGFGGGPRRGHSIGVPVAVGRLAVAGEDGAAAGRGACAHEGEFDGAGTGREVGVVPGPGPPRAIQFNSIQFNSFQFNSIQFNSVRSSSI